MKLFPAEKLLTHKPQIMILAHWTYTKEEWKNFIRHTKKRSRFWNLLLKPFYSFFDKKIPEIKITPERVLIGTDQQHFNNKEFQVTTIDIRGEGDVNILAIGYERMDNNAITNEIKIPVPKGKLREAIEVQERLNLESGTHAK